MQRLQAKGVRRQIAERLLESSGPSQQDVLSSVEAIMSVSDAPISRNVLERQVRRQLNPLMTKATSESVLSKSILPTIAGEQFSERIIADVVNEIASYADRETLVENSAGQQQLMNSLERTVSKLVSQTRNARMPDFDWVDAVAQNQDVDVDGQDNAVAESTPSPWFTRVEERCRQRSHVTTDATSGYSRTEDGIRESYSSRGDRSSDWTENPRGAAVTIFYPRVSRADTGKCCTCAEDGIRESNSSRGSRSSDWTESEQKSKT